MRPRSRLLAKRGLPTIREGYEELVQDLNQTNSQRTTTQDYFLSICHLARPTFPLHEPDYDILSIGPLDSPKPCLRLHRLRQHLQPPQPHTSSSNDCAVQQAHKEKEIRCAPSEPMQSQIPEEDNGCRGEGPGPTDPLEYLYSHRGALASSTRRGSIPPRRPRCDTLPCFSSTPDTQRKSSWPELCLAETVTTATVLQRSPLNRKKLDDSNLAARSGIPNKLDGTPAGWRGKSGRCMDKQTIVSHWIAECRSAWKEARIRACMLPAIAEK